MADYTPVPQRFLFGGLMAVPPDVLPAGKLPYARNVRSYEAGTITPRAGWTAVVTPSLGAAIHTLARLNDPTTFNGGVSAVRILGSGANLFRGLPSDATPGLVDTGYSGGPLVWLTAQPPKSPRPWAYFADSARYRKFTTDGNAVEVGIAQPSAPTTEPGVAVQAQKLTQFDIITSTAWSAAGDPASAPTTLNRIDTTISQILYDSGATGYCSIVPADLDQLTVGTLLTVGDPLGVFENALITDITIAVANTTVEAIIYDVGNTGLCTIQPAGSLGTGQIEAPPVQAYRQRAIQQQANQQASHRLLTLKNGVTVDTVTHQPVTLLPKPQGPVDLATLTPDPNAPVRTIRQVDFPVDCLVTLAGGETVRILSVAVGPDGTQSFRCSTSVTINPGDTIVGVAAIRLFLTGTFTPGQGLLRQALQNTLTYAEPAQDTKAILTGGIQALFAENLAQFSDGTSVLPEDELHVAVRIDRMTEVKSVRVYIDVDAETNDFLENYYFYEWRASDIISAIQATNAASVTPLIDARKTVVTNSQLNQRVIYTPHGPVTVQSSSPPVAGNAVTDQLALGNSQWVDLRVKIGALVRVGTDPTRTLANAEAFEILVSAEAPTENVVPEPLTVQYSDLQIYGGGGPDVGTVGDPYVYTYRYRSSSTGAVSNTAPPSRGGVIARRQNIDLTPTISADPQVDKIDWFRLGGALTQYTYVGTGENSATPYEDRYEDSSIDGGETIDYGNFQPWPLLDLPRTGTCNVSGTAIEWVSGDLFQTAWAPGSIILVNGRATTLYASPASTTLLHVVDSIGSGSAVDFALPGATLLSQPLGRIWGPYQNTYFACGDQTNPGTLYWTRGNNIEAADDKNALIVTSPSEPLQNGFIYNTFPGVFSSEDLYGIIFDPIAQSFRTIRTPCGRGLWTPWAFDIGPKGIYFLSADGIFVTSGGSPAVSVTGDLRAIFPKDGVPGTAVNGIPPPDMSDTSDLRLSYIAGWLYFDYEDLDGAGHTLILDTETGAWYLDDSDQTRIAVRVEEPGAGVYDQILGGDDGQVYQYDDGELTDAGTALPWAVHTPWPDADLPRLVKQWGDASVDFDPAGSVNGLLCLPVIEDGTINLPSTVVGDGLSGRDAFIIPLPAGGVLSRNLGMEFSSSLTTEDTGRPTLFWWEPTFVPKAEDISTRATDWSNLGYVGAKFIQGVIIRANTYGETQTLQIQKDGGEVALEFDITHDGEITIAYPNVAAGWTPFVSELVRIVPTNLDIPWQLLEYRFVFEPAPELATQWETQFTSQDWPGYGTVTDMVFAYESTAIFTLLFTYDDRTQTYLIPSSGGVYRRYYFRFCPNKAKAVKYRWTIPVPGRIFKRDVTTRICGWGDPGGYRVVAPFGGPSRADGAAI